MIPHVFRPPLAGAVAAGLAVLTTASLWAIHPQSAGPQNFEIKFKLPPPKPLTPEEQLATFKVAPGFKVELVAAEPLVETPVAMSWDDKGRMFVCEMRGYMHDVEGAGEDQPTGVIAMLEDTDGDGKMDKRTVFADGLVLPRAIMCVNGGVLVGEPPALWFMKDTDGDGKADVKEAVDTQFGSRTGQPEHMANSPTWMMDNWIQVANHSTRYRFKNGKFISESTTSRGQWGMTQDDYGRPFYNYNSDLLRSNFVSEPLVKRNPNYAGNSGVGVQVMKQQTCWPSAPTPGVNRGYEPKQLRADGTLTTVTATCGATIYRGDVFPKEFHGNAFIPEPAGNLVKRLILSEKDAVISASNAYENTEFWTSTDERFRPSTAYTGPDGALYVADMYRGVIQHKGFLTHYLVANIKDRKLEQPINAGRIWRVVPDGSKPAPVKLPAESEKLVEFLGNSNGWARDTAQRVLVERGDASVKSALVKMVQSAASPLGKLHALWTLEGLGAATPDVIVPALQDSDAKVRAAAVRLADRSLAGELAKLLGDASVDVQIALGFNLSTLPDASAQTIELIRRAGNNALVRDAILSGLRGRELEMLESLLASKGEKLQPSVLTALSQAVLTERRSARVQKLIEVIAALPANSPEQLALLGGAKPVIGQKPKLLYLDSEAKELAQLATSLNEKAKPLLAAFDARVAWPGKPGVPPPPVVKPLTAGQQQLFETGKTVYGMLCAGCHQANGAGMDGLAPPLADSDWVLGKPEVLPRILIHGLSGPIKVNGKSWSMEMPPLGAALTDEQVAGVITYIRREWEHTASPMSVNEVAKIRAEHKDRTTAWTAEEIAPYMATKAAKR